MINMIKRNRRGFTLVELLVSASISVIIGAAMSFAISKVGGQASGGSQATALSQELKPSLDFISDEVQQASRLYGLGDFTSATLSGATGVQPVIGFYAPDVSTATTDDYKFMLFYLADRPDTTNYNGPKVLYYYQDTTNTTITSLSTQAVPTTLNVSTGRVLADNLTAQSTTNCLTNQNTTNCINTAVVDITKKTGIVYLTGTTTNMSGQQSLKTADQSLAVQTRITARN